MATPWENLLANAASNNLLSTGGMLRQYDYWKRFRDAQNVIDPKLGLALDVVSGDSNDFMLTEPTVTREPHEYQDLQDAYEYWGGGGRTLAQIGGAITGVPFATLTDYAMGRNIHGDIGAGIGAGMLGQGAASPQEFIARSVAGGIAGDIAATEIGKQFGIGQYRDDVYQIGEKVANALGYDISSPFYEQAREMTLEYVEEKLDEGKTWTEIGGEVEGFKQEDLDWHEGPVEIEERSLMPGERVATDYRGTISPVEAFEAATKEPESVSDFAGMFTGIADTVGSWFGGAQDTVTGYVGGDSTPDYTGLTETGQIDWTRYGDTDEGEEEAQSGFNDSSHNWN